MATIDYLKSKKLPIGVFAGVKKAPSPARIFITLKYDKQFEFLRGVRGFKFNSNNTSIKFEIPVMPPTLKIDFGNAKDTENVTRIGEVVLPKYQKAMQIRWQSFFPYDTQARYINTSIRNLSFDALKSYKDKAVNFVSDAWNTLTGVENSDPTPALYINIFQILTQTEEPFTVAMSFYDGGNLSAIKMTLDTFQTEPENNGDFSYEISIIEWKDISPKQVNGNGQVVEDKPIEVEDNIQSKFIQSLNDFWKFTKKCYSTVSKPLIWAFATYNGVRNMVFDGILKAWKIKGALKGLSGRFGILNNMFGLSKITSKETKYISDSLKKLSFTKASRQMAEFLQQNKKYNS